MTSPAVPPATPAEKAPIVTHRHTTYPGGERVHIRKNSRQSTACPIVRLLTEISALSPARVLVVYHPYYEPFIHWARRALTSGATARYHRTAGCHQARPGGNNST